MVLPHGLSRPTPVSGKVVYSIFRVLIFKTYMYYVFKTYMYYKRNTGGLWLHPSPAFSEKVFRSTRDFEKKLIHRSIFRICVVDTVLLLMRYFINCFQLLVIPNW